MKKTDNEVLDTLGFMLEILDHEAGPDFGDNGVVSEDGQNEGIIRTSQAISEAKKIYNKYAGIVPEDLTKAQGMAINPPLYPAQRNYIKGALIELCFLLTESFATKEHMEFIERTTDELCGSVSLPPDLKDMNEEVPSNNRIFLCDECDFQHGCERVFGHKGKNCRIILLGMVYKKRSEYTEPIKKESNVKTSPDLDQ